MPSHDNASKQPLDRVKEFCSLSPDAGRLALAMALIGRAGGAADWSKTMKDLQIQDELGRNFDTAKISNCIIALESEGFASIRTNVGKGLNDLWVMPFLKAWFKYDSRFFLRAISHAVKSYTNHFEDYRRKYYNLDQIFPAQRSIILAFICSDQIQKAEAFIRRISRHGEFIETLNIVAPFINFEELSKLSDEFRGPLENIKMNSCIHWMTDPMGLIEYLRKNAKNELNLRMLAELYVMLGEFEEAGKVAKKLESLGTTKGKSNSALIAAWIAFIQGNDDAAINGYRAALNALVAGTQRKKDYPGGIASPFILLALLRRGQKGDLALFKTYLGWGKQLEKGYCRGYLEALSAMESIPGTVSNSASIFADAILKAALDKQSGNLLSLLNVLIVHWTVPEALDPVGEKVTERLVAITKAATTMKYRWVAKEALELIAVVSKEKTMIEKARELANKIGGQFPETVPLTNVSKPVPLWEKSLASLESYLATRGNEMGSLVQTHDRSMLWGISTDGYFTEFEILPFERKRLKSGKWSKPRKLSLQTVQNSYRDWNHLSEADRKVAALIHAEYGMRWHYRNPPFVIPFESALPHLKGHPHVYLTKLNQLDTTRPLTVSEEMPTVTLREIKEGGMEINIYPIDLDAKVGEWFFEITEGNELNFCRISESLIRLVKAFPTEISRKIPAEARDQISAAVSRMSGDIVVQGDEAILEGTDVRKVECDGSIRLRLTPSGEGLMVKFLVSPLGEKGSVFVPGIGNESVFGRDEKGAIRTTRDLRLERSTAEDIINHAPVLSESREGDSMTWTLPDMLQSLELLLSIREMEKDMRPEMEWPEGETFSLGGLADTSNFSLRLNSGTNWLEASGELEIDESTVLTMQTLLRLMNESGNSRFIRLDDGQFLALTEKFKKHLDDIRALAQKVDVKDGEVFRLPEVSGHLLEGFAEEARTQSNAAWKRRIAKLDEAHQLKFWLPKTLQATLRPYQEEGFRWLVRLAHWTGGACLADDMGLGKTVQALGFLLHRAADGPSLIVAPTSVAANWADEALRFTPTLNIRIFRGTYRAKALEDLGPRDMVIATYGLLQSESEAFAAIHWNTVVIDEAQAIKNRATLRYKAAVELKANFRLITTGTPVENHLDELHNLFHFIQPGLLGGPTFFKQRFANPIEQRKDDQARDRLRRIINPFILRRLKSEVLRDLPEKTEITLQVELSTDERAFYEALRRNAVENVKADKSEDGAIKILAELMRLRRACCNPSLIDPKTAPASSKLAVFRETLGEILEGGHRVLVFSQFVDHLAILRKTLETEKIEYQYLDGSTTPKQRKTRIDAFQNGDGEVFLISLKAGGFGLNLTAADYVIHMDPWWNPAVEDQASDRAHRIGQTRPVTIYRLVTMGTIEEKIVELHRQKRDLAESLLTGTDTASRLDAKQLKALLTEP